jgi:hypothetical protein
MTSTPPRGLSAAAHAPISLRPLGPTKVIGSVGTAWTAAFAARLVARAFVVAGASLANAAIKDEAAVMLSPSRPSRRSASRRVMIPSAWSTAISSARYFSSSVIAPSVD